MRTWHDRGSYYTLPTFLAPETEHLGPQQQRTVANPNLIDSQLQLTPSQASMREAIFGTSHGEPWPCGTWGWRGWMPGKFSEAGPCVVLESGRACLGSPSAVECQLYMRRCGLAHLSIYYQRDADSTRHSRDTESCRWSMTLKPCGMDADNENQDH